MHFRRAALVVALELTVVAGLSALVASPAAAVDQKVLGKTFLVKDPKPGVDPSKRSVGVLGKEAVSDDSVVGNPLTSGATVEIIANGTNPTDQTFTLPPGAAAPGSPGWKVIGKPVIGYGYNDAGGVNGPVKTAQIKKTPSGTFLVMATIKGVLGPGPQPHITVVPPAPGTNGGMRFTITGGDSYCVAFGGAAGGKVTNAPAKGTPNKVFKIASPTTEGCPSPQAPVTTTTTTTTSTTTTTTTCPSPTGTVVKGSLTATPGRFTYNATLGLPGANAACNTNFPGSHACTLADLQSAPASDLACLKDTASMTVTSFWAIDPTAPALQQCVDDVPLGSNQNWEYATAHTMSRGEQVPLNNTTGTLGAVQMSIQCNIAGTSWVGCCQ